MKIYILLCLALPLSIEAQAKDISVLTWNTFLVPPPFNSTRQVERVDRMAQKLRALDRDIIFFQEAFIETKRDLIIKELKPWYPYIAVPKKGGGLFQFLGAGLFIVSKFPMKVLDQVVFEDCSGTDCFASKSAIIVEITLSKNKKIQMIDTHLQGWDNVNIRKKQLIQIKYLMKSNAKPGIAQVLIGDLNIDGNTKSEFADSLVLMNMTSSPLVGRLGSTNGFSTVGCFETPGGQNKGEWLDHIWLNSNGSETEIHSKNIVPIIGRLGPSVCPLSDHYAVEAFIKLGAINPKVSHVRHPGGDGTIY
ncbi:MAG: sphingomyelin phosphodiesterase [Bacteriovorax sp.]|jgi:endonuclease/exonuclease/phosphatase family metal-dependent hydrolase